MQKLERYRTLFESCAVDGIWLTGEVNRKYCTGADIAEGMTLLTQNAAYYFTDSRYLEDAERSLPGFTVQKVDTEHPYVKLLGEAIAAQNVQKLGFEEDELTAGQYRKYQKELPVELVPMQKELSSFRQVKTERELAYIRKAQAITDETFTFLLGRIREGMTERELKAELICSLYRLGSEGPSFDPIVLFGENTSKPHGVAGERTLGKGEFITLDFGCRCGGYCSDMTRTLSFGEPTAEMREIYALVLRAQEAAIAATRAGVPGCEIDGVARKIITDAGYGEYFGHGYGHGVGLKIHEAPFCNKTYEKPLPVGAVCSAEPGVYLPGKFGVRIEDMVVIREGGVENLTASPKNLIIL